MLAVDLRSLFDTAKEAISCKIWDFQQLLVATLANRSSPSPSTFCQWKKEEKCKFLFTLSQTCFYAMFLRDKYMLPTISFRHRTRLRSNLITFEVSVYIPLIFLSWDWSFPLQSWNQQGSCNPFLSNQLNIELIGLALTHTYTQLNVCGLVPLN